MSVVDHRYLLLCGNADRTVILYRTTFSSGEEGAMAAYRMRWTRPSAGRTVTVLDTHTGKVALYPRH